MGPLMIEAKSGNQFAKIAFPTSTSLGTTETRTWSSHGQRSLLDFAGQFECELPFGASFFPTAKGLQCGQCVLTRTADFASEPLSAWAFAAEAEGTQQQNAGANVLVTNSQNARNARKTMP